MTKRGQVAQMDTLAGAVLFMAFVAVSVHVLARTAAGAEAYASGTAQALAMNASIQKAVYVLSESNGSLAGIGAENLAQLNAGAFHQYNGSRLIVMNGSIYVLSYG